MKNRVFTLPETIDRDSLISELSQKYQVKDEPPEEVKTVYYDTFDWRLFADQLTLCSVSGHLSFCSVNDDNTCISLKLAQKPHFVKELPEGELKSKLTDIVEMRALMNVLETTTRTKTLSILKENEKPAAVVKLEECQCSQNSKPFPSVQYVHLEPVKGEKKLFKELSVFLSEKGLGKQTDEKTFMSIITAMDIKPGQYSSKMAIELKPEMPSDEASRIILRHLLKVMKANEEGIKKDIDSEFLHDFRVAVRRTRAFFSEVKNVLPQAVTDRFKVDFKSLGKESNMLRDLDVYLLDQDCYTMLLPEHFRNDIAPLFVYLSKQKEQELTKVIKVINSEKYSKILTDWETFLNTPLECEKSEKNACIPIFNLAQKRIYKSYRTVIMEGNEISDTSPDEMLHELRITCKKLRYLMEFFSSLYPQKKIKALIKQLKKLQDNLGKIQDLSIQVSELQSFVENLPLNGRQSRRTIMATGILIGTLERERWTVRHEFAKIFEHFSSVQNRKHFKELFALSGMVHFTVKP